MTDHAVSSSTPAAAGLPPRTRIKLCGLSKPTTCCTRPRSVPMRSASCSTRRARAVSIAQAAELARLAPPFVSVVGLFVNATEAEIEAVVRDVPLTLLQFHGDETPEQCDALGRAARLPWLRAVRVPSTQSADLVESGLHYSKARGLLFDTLVPDYGGSGKVFDWSLIPAEPRIGPF